MKYKTTIEIVSEANDKNEAMDIVGEYLSGNIHSGVQMKYLTGPAQSYPKIIVTSLLFLALLGGSIFSALYSKPGTAVLSATPGVSAIQPPLKTSIADKKSEAFKREWQTRQVKEALDLAR